MQHTVVGFDERYAHSTGVWDDSRYIHGQRVDPFRVDGEHVNDKVRCALCIQGELKKNCEEGGPYANNK